MTHPRRETWLLSAPNQRLQAEAIQLLKAFGVGFYMDSANEWVLLIRVAELQSMAKKIPKQVLLQTVDEQVSPGPMDLTPSEKRSLQALKKRMTPAYQDAKKRRVRVVREAERLQLRGSCLDLDHET